MQNVSNIYRQLMEKPHWAEVSVAVGEHSRLITKQGECITFGGVSILTGTAGGDGGYREGMLKNVKTSHSVFPGDVPYIAPDKQLDVEPEPVPDSGTIHRVQVGAFRKKENAEAYLQKVHEVLPEAFIVVG